LPERPLGEPLGEEIAMSSSLLEAAFAHHVWAMARIIDACRSLTAEELDSSVVGTRGPVFETLHHLVDSDTEYLFILTGDRAFVDVGRPSLAELRAVVDRNGRAWGALIAGSPDPDEPVHEVDETDGFERSAPIGFRLAQALHHGTDHRSQICTALTALGVEPPGVDVWTFGVDSGRIEERMPEG
jgi:uncharacterized damage-inducible protein DinB